ncbi:hypothetical protein ACHHYP_14921 [Achlya hypogyna]|uniref:Uncharacterized protein n=1 Tax=Achlya hypogyna TaxID=1202772 RepID=A0A1V9YBW7_ACHHY|nr:hypothetical protein ACHHYP_14921 [Achlya hypogyna]
MQPDLALDQRGDGMYSGTFRWTEHKKFPTLPARSGWSPDAEPLARGWQGYLEACHKTSLVTQAAADPSFLDALSFPMTFVYATKLLKAEETWGHRLTIVVVGATVKAEQRIWAQTDYWAEIAAFYPHRTIDLWFVGPEVAPQTTTTLTTGVTVHAYRGTAGAFLASHQTLDVQSTVIIGYNTGFGNFVESGRHDLLWSWLPDLYAITASGMLAIFACANDYADMNGEFAVHSRILGSNVAYLPRDNPFSAASHLHEDGKRDSAWSRANSFLYAVQGVDLKRRRHLRQQDVSTLLELLEADSDLHLVDRLGRHFFRGTVLSREQATKFNLLQRLNVSTKAPTAPVATILESLPIASTEQTTSRGKSGEVNRPKSPQKPTQLRPPATAPPSKAPIHSAEEDVMRMDASSDPKPAQSKQPPSEVTPSYEIVSDMANTKMSISIHTPELVSVKDMILEVSSIALMFAVPGRYHLELQLPWPVDNSSTNPKYSKRAHTLTVSLLAPTA